MLWLHPNHQNMSVSLKVSCLSLQQQTKQMLRLQHQHHHNQQKQAVNLLAMVLAVITETPWISYLEQEDRQIQQGEYHPITCKI